MINVKRINGRDMVVNADSIDTVESKPDTIITMNNGNKIIVLDSVSEIVKKVIEYRRKINQETKEKRKKMLEEG